MTGLRCGAPFIGCCCPGARPDFVAIGKAWGFSGVLAQRDAAKLVPWEKVSRATKGIDLTAGAREFYHRDWLYNLNGFYTMRISCGDALRATQGGHDITQAQLDYYLWKLAVRRDAAGELPAFHRTRCIAY